MRYLIAAAGFAAAAAFACDARAEDDSEIIGKTEALLIRQMEVFDGIRPAGQPPLVQTFGWKIGLTFPPDQPGELNPPPCPRPLPDPMPPCAPAPPGDLPYRGDVYDQSLAVIWFVERARIDFAEGRIVDGENHLARARLLLDALLFLAEHDRSGEGWLRTCYWANNLLSPDGTESSIMDASAWAGNVAWAGIAFTRFYHLAHEAGYLDAATRLAYLDGARARGEWIITHCSATGVGFIAGYDELGNHRTWKSTENNIDVYVLGRNLFDLTCERKWKEMADCAQAFVKSMFDETLGCYLTGTTEDGITPNPSPIPADAQAWAALARIDTDADHAVRAMNWLVANLALDCPGGGKGVRFSTEGARIVTEVLAHAAFAALCQGRTADADPFLSCLEWIRVNAAPPYDGIEDGLGYPAAPDTDAAWTGYGWWYYKLRHTAATAWTGLAYLYKQGHAMANPLQPLAMRQPCGDCNADCAVNILDLLFVRDRINRLVDEDDCRHADANKDGKVNILDLICVRNNINSRCEPQACR